MKGLLYYNRKDLRYSEEIPDPEIVNDNDVKIKVAYCGICGTDLHEYLEGPIFFPKVGSKDGISGYELPQCPGHEMSGVVSAVGQGVTRVKVGDRVVCEATAHCSDRARYKTTIAQDIPECVACQHGKPNCCKDLNFLGLGTCSGGFGQYVVYGENHILKLTDKIPIDIAALVEPISVAWHAIECSGFKPGSSALVLGGGPIGLATILALKGHQAGKIVVSEPAKIRREFALKLGAQVFDPASSTDSINELKALVPENEGFQYSYDASGVQSTLTTSIDALGPGGIATNIAIWADHPVNYIPMALTYQEKFATGSMGYVVKDFADVIAAMDRGLIPLESCRVLITGKVAVKDTLEKGYRELIEHKESNVKILVHPNEI